MTNEKNTTSVDIQQELLEAIYTIASGVVKRQKYNITKECKIIEVYLDDKGHRTGKYKVKSQDAVFDAYARQNEIYSLDQMVYVEILNGDYDSDKFITGQKINKYDESDIYNLKMPFDNFLGLYNLTQYDPMIARGYWANCPDHGNDKTDVAIRDEHNIIFPKSDDHVWHWENVTDTNIYAHRLGFEVDVTTLLHGYNLISGHYGLRIVVGGELKGGENSSNYEHYRTYNFYDSQMYGNPYAYTAPTTQQLVIDVREFQRIDTIDVWFYQDHDFKDETGALIPYGSTDYSALTAEYEAEVQTIRERNDLTPQEKDALINECLQRLSAKINNSADLYNIHFENLHCLMGFLVDELDDETVTLYTYDAISYGIDTEDERVRRDERTLNGI